MALTQTDSSESCKGDNTNMARHRAAAHALALAAALLFLAAAAATAQAQTQQQPPAGDEGDEVQLSLHGDGSFDETAYSYPISQYPGCGDAPVQAGEAGALEAGLTDCTLSPTLSGPGTTILYTFRVPDDAASASPMSINFQLRVSGGDVDMCVFCVCVFAARAQRGGGGGGGSSSLLHAKTIKTPQPTHNTQKTHTTQGPVLPGRRARQPAERAALRAVQPAERAGELPGRAGRRPGGAPRRVGAAPDRQPRHQAQGVSLWGLVPPPDAILCSVCIASRALVISLNHTPNPLGDGRRVHAERVAAAGAR